MNAGVFWQKHKKNLTTVYGFTFKGWFKDATGGAPVTFPLTVGENVTLYAQWEEAAPASAPAPTPMMATFSNENASSYYETGSKRGGGSAYTHPSKLIPLRPAETAAPAQTIAPAKMPAQTGR